MATAKQIAARAKFAAMARSGAFKRKPGANRRKANPAERDTSVLHVYINRGRDHVAMITKQHPGADTYQAQTPWLLLLDDGRVRSFGSFAEAKDEAMKRWAPVTFRRDGLKSSRKANPVPPKRGDSDEYFIEVEGGGWLVDYKTHSRPINWQYSRAFSGAQSFNVAQAARVKSVCDEYGLKCAVMPVTENPAKRGAVKNPAKRKSVPYRNQAKETKRDDPSWIGYGVHRVGSPSSVYAVFPVKADAIEYAQKLADDKRTQMGVSRFRYKVQQ